MKQALGIAIPLLLLVGACGGKEDVGNNSSDSGGGSVQEQTPANLQDDPQNSAVPLTTPTMAPAASPTPIAQLPTAFQGRWGMVEQDCVPTNRTPKELMIVSPDGLGLKTSTGAIEKIVSATPGTLVADINFTSNAGGQQWLRRETLTLLDDGKTLVRGEQNPPGSFRYVRCPAGNASGAAA